MSLVMHSMWLVKVNHTDSGHGQKKGVLTNETLKTRRAFILTDFFSMTVYDSVTLKSNYFQPSGSRNCLQNPVAEIEKYKLMVRICGLAHQENKILRRKDLSWTVPRQKNPRSIVYLLSFHGMLYEYRYLHT